MEANIVRARSEGAATIGATSIRWPSVASSIDVTVRSAAMTVQEHRSERRPCTGPYGDSPLWLFPVYESGTITIENITNPGWGSPSQYITQLTADGRSIRTWLVFGPGYNTAPMYRSASVPGGYMYSFTMAAELGLCGDFAATFTRPN
jgi:hypothetical protein